MDADVKEVLLSNQKKSSKKSGSVPKLKSASADEKAEDINRPWSVDKGRTAVHTLRTVSKKSWLKDITKWCSRHLRSLLMVVVIMYLPSSLCAQECLLCWFFSCTRMELLGPSNYPSETFVFVLDISAGPSTDSLKPMKISFGQPAVEMDESYKQEKLAAFRTVVISLVLSRYPFSSVKCWGWSVRLGFTTCGCNAWLYLWSKLHNFLSCGYRIFWGDMW